MSEPTYISLAEAARYEGLNKWAYMKRLQRLQSKGQGITLYSDPADARRKRIRLQDLSAPALARWGREQRQDSGATALATLDSGSLFSLAPAPPLPASVLSEAEKQKALARWRIIAPMLNGDWQSYRGQRLSDGREIQSKSAFVQWLAEQRGMSPNTLWNWRDRYLKHGLPGLRRKPRADKGDEARPLTEQEKAEVRANRLKGLSVKACREELKQLAQEQGRGEPPPLWKVQQFARTIPRSSLTRALIGAKAYERRELPWIPLRHDDYEPLGLVTLDHTQLDNPVNYFGRACFPWLTAVLDFHSRFPIGFWLAEIPSSFTIAMSCRMTWLFFGPFDEILLDRGRDMRSRYIAGAQVLRGRQPRPFWWPTDAHPASPEQEEWQGILGSAGCKEVRFSLGDHPQTKWIERAFRTWKDQFCTRFPAYRGRGPKAKGMQARSESVDELLREHKQDPARSPLMDIQTYARLFFRYLYEEYAEAEHRGQGMNGRTPAQAFRPRKPLLAGPTDELLMKREVRVVERGGVQLHRERYESYELVAHNGHTVQVAYTPGGLVLPELDEAIVYCLMPECEGCTRIRARYSEPLSFHRGVDDEKMQRRLAERARFLKAQTALIAQAHCAAEHADPLRRRLLALQASTDTPVSTPISPPDPRLRPEPRREKPRFANERAAAVLATMEEEAQA